MRRLLWLFDKLFSDWFVYTIGTIISLLIFSMFLSHIHGECLFYNHRNVYVDNIFLDAAVGAYFFGPAGALVGAIIGSN